MLAAQARCTSTGTATATVLLLPPCEREAGRSESATLTKKGDGGRKERGTAHVQLGVVWVFVCVAAVCAGGGGVRVWRQCASVETVHMCGGGVGILHDRTMRPHAAHPVLG
eukprot:156577-Chlamydomonas_euryale.AAC.1